MKKVEEEGVRRKEEGGRRKEEGGRRKKEEGKLDNLRRKLDIYECEGGMKGAGWMRRREGER
jgi:hypothetical protein